MLNDSRDVGSLAGMEHGPDAVGPVPGEDLVVSVLDGRALASPAGNPSMCIFISIMVQALNRQNMPLIPVNGELL